MNIRELINELSILDPDSIVIVEVNADVTRTGDYWDVSQARPLSVEKVHYGGYSDKQLDEPNAVILDIICK